MFRSNISSYKIIWTVKWSKLHFPIIEIYKRLTIPAYKCPTGQIQVQSTLAIATNQKPN